MFSWIRFLFTKSKLDTSDAALAAHEAALVEHQIKVDQAAAELVDLESERQRLLSARNFLAWEEAIKHQFDEETAQKLIAQEIEVGMGITHLVASFGEPSQVLPGEHDTVVFLYGTTKTGSFFRLRNNIVIEAIVEIKPLPPVPDTEDW